MIKTATLRRKSKFQVKCSKYGARNVWCPKYSACLDQCLADNLPGFTCHGCQHQNNHDAGPRDSQEVAEDAIQCRALLYAALGQVKRESAFKIAGAVITRDCSSSGNDDLLY